nr:cytochrome P450 2J3-like [Anolis sagrei ordinatus]
MEDSKKMLGKLGFLVTLIPRLILRFLKQFWSCKRYPPGPFRLPLIGGVWRFGVKLTEDTFKKMAKQYGNVYMIWVGNYPAVVLSGYEAVKEGMIDHLEDFAERPVSPFLQSVVKKRGIVFSNGHTWKQQRRFGVVTMRKLGLGKKGMEQQVEDEAHRLIECFAKTKGKLSKETQHKQEQEISEYLNQELESRNRGTITFSNVVSSERPENNPLMSNLCEIFPGVMKYFPGPHKRAISSMNVILSYARKEVERHKVQQNQHEPQDIIDYYLLQMDKSKDDPTSTYNEDNLVQCIFDLFIAGTDTTATSLQWSLLLMVTYPDIQEKIQKEIDTVLNPTQSISYQERKKMPFTHAVIHEILRTKFVLLFGIPRQCAKDVKMRGFFIPKGAFIAPDLRSVLFDPKHWETPNKFNPYHFLDQEGNFVTRDAFLPFGAGARSCVGEQMARIELFIFLTNLLRAFTFHLPEGVKKLNQEPIVGLTMHPRPYKICAIPRFSTT